MRPESTLLRRFVAIAATAAALSFGAVSADATLVTFNGFAAGSENVRIMNTANSSHPALDEDAAAGGLSMTIDGNSSFVAYCVDLYQTIYFNQPYSSFTLVPGRQYPFANANAALDIGKLFFADGATLATGTAQQQAIKQAAFQSAIWEIAYELSGHYDVFSGNLELANYSNSPDTGASLTLANQWLAALPSVHGAYDLIALSSPTDQDQSFATNSTPEPHTVALVGIALLALGWATRRKSSRAG